MLAEDEGAEAPYDCQSCGACCVHLGPYDGVGYVPLGRHEAAEMRAHGLRVVEAALGQKCLAVAPHDGAWGYSACVAFDGELGGRCGCSVYEDRPAACREFISGGELCREARERAGLPV
jgi:Fe-S-cluster containining protein